ncbi:MAG: TetR family transcriptional regulator [FCB group bacterium]|nr:TetR family transcriptional regulator [FCB group bacterium]
MRRTKEEAALTEQAILDAAVSVFTSKGFNDTRLEDIAANAGVTRGAIYWHFENKLDIFIHLITSSLKRYEAIIIREIQKNNTPVTTLRSVLTEVLKSDPESDSLTGLFQLHLPGLLMDSSKGETLHAAVSQIMQRINDLLLAVVYNGVDAGQIRTDIRPNEILLFITASLKGIMDERLRVFTGQVFTGDYTQFVDMVISGICANNDE